MTNVWYNAYRPQKFDEVLGQELAVRVLKNAIDKKRVKNGYLLSGSRGVGKTTLARIFANSLNDVANNPTASIDIYEMDAASNTSVDDVRLLIENASTPPLVGDYKIFIIDEVHMLSKSAMNALLKILEEPPVYLVFVLATTNPEKILPTVLSRLIKLDLQDHSIDNLVSNLEMISKKEKIKIDKGSLILIAKKANGGQRDAINYLQTVSEYNLDEYKTSDIASILGIMPDIILEAIIYAVKSNDVTQDYKKSLIANISKLQITPIAMINQLLSKLLDDHFDGKTSNSDLIPALADYASLNLPVSNLVEVIAYLDYKFQPKIKIKEVELNEVKQLDSKPQKTETDAQEAEKKTTKLEQELQLTSINTHIDIVDVIDIIEEVEPEVLEDILTEEIEEIAIESDLIKYNKILQNTIKNSKVPIIIKSNITNLTIARVNQELCLVSSNKKLTFRQPDLDFLDTLFNDLIGGEHNLKANMEVIKVVKSEVNNEINIDGPKPKIAKAVTQNDTDQAFYKIYGKRPINVPESIEIKTDIVASPQKTKTDIDVDDEGIHDLFDL